MTTINRPGRRSVPVVTKRQPSHGVLLRVAYYLLQTSLIALILGAELGIPGRNLNVPIDYRGDTIYEATIVKAIAKEGWWWHVRSLSAPEGAALVAMPILGNLDCAVIKVFTPFTQKVGPVINLYWFTTILLAGFISTWCLLRLGVRRSVAFVVGILYAVSPHVFYRNTAHLMLTHHLIPLVATLSILLAVGNSERLRGVTRYVLLAGCVLIGFSYIYWAFFGVFVILVGSLAGFLRERNYKILAIGGVAAGLVIASAILNLLPSVVSWSAEPGGRTAVAFKSPAEADIYGLRIRHLITPTSHCPVPLFAKLAAIVRADNFPLDQTESQLSRLGTVGSLGFLLSLAAGVLFATARNGPSMGVLPEIGILNLACILLGTVGGFGSLFNAFVRPDIRAYDRMSIYIAFFSLAAFAVVLTKLSALLPVNRWVTMGSTVFLAALLLFGAVDQNESRLLNDLKIPDQQKFQIQSAFVHNIEKALPPDAMVYQLPRLPYGDGDRSVARDPRIDPAAHEEAFLVSTSVRWSWPSTSAEATGFANRVSLLDAEDLADTLYERGFLGIYIDRLGYPDDADSLVAKLKAYLGQQPLQSADRRYVFFELVNMAKRGGPDRSYAWGTPLRFSSSGVARYLGEGWSCPGCTEGKRSTMHFTVSPPPGDMTIRTYVTPALFATTRERPVRVFVNDVLVGEWKVAQPGSYSVSVPHKALTGGKLLLRFELPNASSPKSLGLNEDPRVLGVAFEELELLANGQPPAANGQGMPVPIKTTWGTGVYPEEHGPVGSWHWCSATCEVQLLNSSTTVAHVQVEMSIYTGYKEPARFTIQGPLVTDAVSVKAGGKHLKYRFDVPPGQYVLKMSSDAQRAQAGPDPRDLVFMVTNFTASSGTAGGSTAR